jgi:hypothetical protein
MDRSEDPSDLREAIVISIETIMVLIRIWIEAMDAFVDSMIGSLVSEDASRRMIDVSFRKTIGSFGTNENRSGSTIEILEIVIGSTRMMRAIVRANESMVRSDENRRAGETRSSRSTNASRRPTRVGSPHEPR